MTCPDDDRPSILSGREIGRALAPIGLMLAIFAAGTAIAFIAERCDPPQTTERR